MTLNKTDRIVITLGKQIVSGKYVPVRRRPKRNCVRSLKPRATSFAKCFVR
jgi:hypothetical protein